MFTKYMRRRPTSDLTFFALPYVSMYALEQSVVPNIARARLQHARHSQLPPAFPGIPVALMPATQVGISVDFGVKTHADSCIDDVTETIFWGNYSISKCRFTVTSFRLTFDIGFEPCMLFQKGNEVHGTVPGCRGSVGLVLISKKNTIRQFTPGAYALMHCLPHDNLSYHGAGVTRSKPSQVTSSWTNEGRD